MKQESKKRILKLILVCAGLLCAILLFYLIAHAAGLDRMSEEELQASLQKMIQDSGVVAPLLFILISFLQVTFIPIPGAITILAGNYVFGMAQSFLYSYIGMLAGSMFAYLLGKWIGRPFVNWIAGGKEKVDAWLLRLCGRENVLLFFMFLLPFFPDDLLCSLAGILPLSTMSFFIMQIITRLSSVGATLLLMSGAFIPWEGWGLVVLIGIGILAVIAFLISYRNAEWINRRLADLSDRVLRRGNYKKRENR